MAKAKSQISRRRELRPDLLPPGRNWLGWLTQRRNLWALAFIVLLAIMSAVLAEIGRTKPAYQVDQVVTNPIVARIEFEAIDHEKTLENRKRARDLQPAYYVPNDEYFQQIRDKLDSLGRIVKDPNIQALVDIPEATRLSLCLSPKAFDQLRDYAANAPTANWGQLTEYFMQILAGIAVLDEHRSKVEHHRNDLASEIITRHPDGRNFIRQDDALLNYKTDLKIFRQRLETALQGKVRPRWALMNMLIDIATVNPQPNYLFDPQETARLKQEKEDDSSNEEYLRKQANELLVGSGQTLTGQDFQLLSREREAYRESLGWRQRYLMFPAYLLVFLVIAVGLWTYISAYYPRVANNPLRGMVLTGLLLTGQLFAVSGTVTQPQFVYVTGVFPSIFIAMIVAITYGRRLALTVGVIHALTVVLSLDLPAGFIFVLLSGVAMAAGQLQDVRSRSKLVLVGLWSGVAVALTTLFVGFALRPLHVPGEDVRILIDAALAGATGFTCGMIVQGILPAIEMVFGVTTSMTLKELIDASHPLLRRLAEEAPGTYQHSLRIADMAEAAAGAIGVDGLQCKVGAMYHDIGKINKPLYFVENQGGGPNRHSKLSPAMSLLVIVGHVKDGQELAREYNLPRVLRHFIESHHGTTLVEYFYEAAKQQCGAENRPAPSEFEFRYPGPKPKTKEAAILMLCDGVEGAARTLDEPNPVRIEQLVHNMANKRLMDGQFDECNLTLKEMHKIERAIMKIVCAIYHTRIKYPSDRREEQVKKSVG